MDPRPKLESKAGKPSSHRRFSDETSDPLIVARRRGNARGAKGRTGLAQGRNAPAIGADAWLKGYVPVHWIPSAASRQCGVRWQNLMHHFIAHKLAGAFRELDGSKASGIDRVTKGEYQKHLTEDMAALQVTIRRGGWHPRTRGVRPGSRAG